MSSLVTKGFPLSIWLLSIFSFTAVNAILPTAEIQLTFPSFPTFLSSEQQLDYKRQSKRNDNVDPIKMKSTQDGKSTLTLLASQASFGSWPPMKKKSTDEEFSYSKVAFTSANDFYMCGDNDDEKQNDNDFVEYDSNTVLMVPRGFCTFERKALNAQMKYKAGAIIIYGELSSRYDLNSTSQEVVYPQDKWDYDCDYGEGQVSTNDLSFSPLYDVSNNDLMNNQCDTSQSSKKSCDSHKCLLTGKQGSTSGMSQVCCAWDLHIWLYRDGSIPNNSTDTRVTIPAFYITMTQYDIIENIVEKYGQDQVQVDLYQRDRPTYNASALLIWALGVFVAALASYLSAQDIRYSLNQIKNEHLIGNDSDNAATANRDIGEHSLELTRESMEQNMVPQPASPSGTRSPTLSRRNTSRSSLGEEDDNQANHNNNNRSAYEEETLELTMVHAVFFVVFSSASLLILFFFKIYSVVKIFYAIGCSGAMSQVMIRPLFSVISLYLNWNCHKTLFHTNFLDLGRVSRLDFASTFSGYAIGLTWISLAFTHNNPGDIAFFWITQNIMGISICIIFLSTIRLNSLKVASVLLLAAFFYDIFMVFITPYIFSGKSVMITVATSGGPPKADPTWCEKYPDDKDCSGGDPLPMLLTVPRLFDYQGGASMLGLGDIVLPGLLMSFAARLDDAKKLISYLNSSVSSAVAGSTETGGTCFCSKGYFAPIVVAYAIGLLMANAAVYLMQMGQPALLYLVPMCLGTTMFIGWRKGELSDLWNGSKILRAADDIVSNGCDYLDSDDEEIDGRNNDAVSNTRRRRPQGDSTEEMEMSVNDTTNKNSNNIQNHVLT